MNNTTAYPPCPDVALIKGDGIGPEIADASVKIVEAAGAKINWVPAFAGMACLETHGSPLPQETIDTLEKCGLALKSPLATPIGAGFRSINVSLRKHFDLYANLRPARTIPGVPCRYDNVDLVLVRENTEGMYSGIEHYIDAERSAAESIAIVTRKSSERIVRFALQYARDNNRKKVTIVHKANILKMTSGLFLDVGREVAQDFPDIECNDMIVDATAMRMVVNPESFDVMVTTNLFGDILSDLAAGLIGGLGVAPAANIGADGRAIFEAVHGTAPDIAGKGIGNPSGLCLSACLLLDHIGQTEVASRVREGIKNALSRPETRTGDLGGKANTAQFADAVIRAMG